MKKIFIVFILMLFNFSYGATATNWDSASALKRVNTIGQKILKANNVNHPIQFKVSSKEDINAYANLNKEIYVYKGLLQYVTNDEELAAVISHEMGHIINGHCAKQGVLNTGIAVASSMVNVNSTTKAIGQELAASKLSRNDEKEADISGVDLMAKAGYNPLAMISLLNKISGNYIDILQSHPSGEKRILNVYNYIEYNYPAKLTKGYNTTSYKNALVMLQPSIDKRKKSKLSSVRFEKEQKRLLAKKQKRLKKMQGTSTLWDGYYTTLQLMAS